MYRVGIVLQKRIFFKTWYDREVVNKKYKALLSKFETDPKDEDIKVTSVQQSCNTFI